MVLFSLGLADEELPGLIIMIVEGRRSNLRLRAPDRRGEAAKASLRILARPRRIDQARRGGHARAVR